MFVSRSLWMSSSVVCPGVGRSCSTQDIVEPSTKSLRMVIFIILVGMARALGAVSEDEC